MQANRTFSLAAWLTRGSMPPPAHSPNPIADVSFKNALRLELRDIVFDSQNADNGWNSDTAIGEPTRIPIEKVVRNRGNLIIMKRLKIWIFVAGTTIFAGMALGQGTAHKPAAGAKS